MLYTRLCRYEAVCVVCSPEAGGQDNLCNAEEPRGRGIEKNAVLAGRFARK